MGKVWVQVCTGNPVARAPGPLVGLEREPDRYVVERVSCLDRCTVCEKFVFALVNGRLLAAGSPGELLDEIRRQEPTDQPPAPVAVGDCGMEAHRHRDEQD